MAATTTRLRIALIAACAACGCSSTPRSEDDDAWEAYVRGPAEPERPANPAGARSPAEITWLDLPVSYYDPWIAEALGRFPDRPSWRAQRWLQRVMREQGHAKPTLLFPPQAPAGGRPPNPVTPEAVAFLVRTLDHEDWNVRSLAAFVLGELGATGRGAAPRLARQVRDAHPIARAAAAHALGRLQVKDRDALDALTDALRDVTWVRYNAARALVEAGADPAVAMPAFIDMLERESDAIRSGVAFTLHKVARRAKDAAPALIRCLDSKDRGLRANVIYVLRDMGPDAQSALPALRERLSDPDENIRALAAEAIRAIEGR